MNRAVGSLAVVMVAACGGAVKKTPRPTPTQTPTQTPTPTPAQTSAGVSLESIGLHGEWIDRGADPCEDFFQFACGKWLERTEIPADQARWGQLDESRQRNLDLLRGILEQAARAPGDDPVTRKIGAYYASCMDEGAVERAGTRALAPLLAATRKVKNVPSLVAAIPVLHAHRIFVLFSIAAVQDVKDSTRVIADIDQAGLGLPGRDLYLAADDRSRGLRKAYLGYVERMLQLSGRAPAEARRGAADVLAVETELAKHMLSPVEQRDPLATYNRLDRDGLARETPFLGWDQYFKGLGRPDVHEISVHSVAYTRFVETALTRFRPPQWRSYLDFHVLHAMAPYLGKRFVDARFSLTRLVAGLKEQPPRWRRCVHYVDQDLGELLAQPYVAAAFPGESKQRAAGMVQEIVRAFDEALSGVDWLDEPTRDKAREKLRKLDLMIGYPARWRGYDFDIDRKNLALNRLRAGRFELARQLAKIGKPVDRGEFQVTPQTVDAYYDASLNQMVFPAGILQPPFYDAKGAPAVNLGGIGALVGHELTHGFDDQGARFGGDGNLSRWWTEEIERRFNERTRCVADFYGQYEVLPGVKLDGELSVGENIADIGGVKSAFRAYRTLRKEAEPGPVAGGFSEDQQFFLAHAQAYCEKATDEYTRTRTRVDPHAPARFRVDGALSHVRDFAAAFQCKPGQKMRPEKICEVW